MTGYDECENNIQAVDWAEDWTGKWAVDWAGDWV